MKVYAFIENGEDIYYFSSLAKARNYVKRRYENLLMLNRIVLLDLDPR